MTCTKKAGQLLIVMVLATMMLFLADFTLQPHDMAWATPGSLTLAPSSGPVGTVVTIVASGYEGITCSLSSSPDGLFSSSTCSISSGTLTGGFTVASGAAVGCYAVTIVTSVQSEASSAAFCVTTPTGAVIQNDSMWIDAAGNFHVFGEAKNTGDAWLEFVKVTGTFKDQTGTVVDVIFTFTQVEKVAPGSVAPFDLVEPDQAKASQIQSYSLALEFQETDAVPVKLAILNVGDSKDAAGYLEVAGDVENQGDAPSTFTKVTGTFYHGAQVVYTGFTFTSPNTVPPGERHGFKLTVLSDERSGIIDHYALTAEGSEYASVPETPWPALMLVAVLTLTGVATRRRSVRSPRGISDQAASKSPPVDRVLGIPKESR